MKKANNTKELIDSIRGGKFTLDGSDLIVSTDFDCIDNKLTTLKGAPDWIGGSFTCEWNEIRSLEHSPTHVENNYHCSYNNISTFHNIHKHILYIGGTFTGYNCNSGGKTEEDSSYIPSNILGLLLIAGIGDIKMNRILNPIMNKSRGKAALYKCAQELINAGYPELAKI